MVDIIPAAGRPPRAYPPVGQPTGRPRDWITFAPPGWNRHWLTARGIAQGGGAQARVVWLGDSLGVGQNAPSGWFEKGFVGLLRTELQRLYGDGGSGFIGPTNRAVAQNAGGGQVTSTGAWTDVGGEGGVAGLAVRPTVASNGATMTFPFRGTAVDIYSRTDVTFGSFQYRIDGGSLTAVAVNAAASNKVNTVTGLANGNHTLQVVANSGLSRIHGVRGRYTGGILLDNASVGGKKIDDLDTASGVSGSLIAGREMVGDTLAAFGPADLVVVALGPNDALNATSHASLSGIRPALDKSFSRIVAASADAADPPSVAVVIEHIGGADTVTSFGLTTYEYAAVVTELYDWARSIGAAVVDNWAQGRHSAAYFRSLGYYDEAATEAVHLNDAGHATTAGPVLDLIAA
jgi:hypothetical protein